MNKVFITGNLGGDPEVVNIGADAKVCKFSVATNEVYYKNEQKQTKTSWHRIEAWNNLADKASRFFQKGSGIEIEGKLEYSEYEKQGVNVRAAVIKAIRIDFPPKAGNSEQVQTPSGSFPAANQNKGGASPQPDDDLPF